MVDIHTHILPHFDDGPQSMEDSLALIEEASRSDVTTFVATSHYYSSRRPLEDFIAGYDAAFTALSNAVRESELPVRLLRGAEVCIDPFILNAPTLKDLCLEGTEHILLEIPQAADDLDETLELIDRIISYYNVTPIIAHVERYDFFFKRFKNLGLLKEMGCLIQIDAECFLQGFFQKRFAFKALNEGYLDVIASDCHDLSKRPPNLASAYRAIESKCGSDAVLRLQEAAERFVSPSV